VITIAPEISEVSKPSADLYWIRLTFPMRTRLLTTRTMTLMTGVTAEGLLEAGHCRRKFVNMVFTLQNNSAK